MTKAQDRIEQLQREIEILKEAVADTENDTIKNMYIESIDEKETEIINIQDGDIIVDDAEYQEQMAEITNDRIDLENSQR